MKAKSIKFVRMTVHEAGKRLLFQLYEIYDDREAANIADMVLEHVTGWKRIDRVVNRDVKISPAMQNQLDQFAEELLTHKPVQYVLNEAWFMNLKLYVDENVLIPRPETEELVQWVINETGSGDANVILDVGTGSGCIALALKKNLKNADVYAIDVSEAALNVAQKNAAINQAEVHFILLDVLNENTWDKLPQVNVVVSNPPYIPLRDKLQMSKNVVEHEPHLALFVPDGDSLLFYKKIAKLGSMKLRAGGCIFVEMHEQLSGEVRSVFEREGFTRTSIVKDMQGKDRLLRGCR
jgi:release factor glutamine methyltransferase